MIIASPSDFRVAAMRRLPRFLFDYIDGGAYDELTCRRNVDDLKNVALRQRILRDVSDIRLKKTLFGRERSMPVALGPVGLSGMYARRGEIQAARAATATNVPMCLSTVSVCPLEEVVSAAADPPWFQLYVIRDRAFMRDLIAKAKALKCEALVFTVDMPTPGARYRDAHSGMSGRFSSIRRICQALAHPSWAWDVGIFGRPHNLGNIAPILGQKSGLEDFIGWMARNFDPTVTWRDLGWIREQWDGPLIIKGVFDPEDAREAVALEADGIVVSNHGGRQLDGVQSTSQMLPRIAQMVRGDLTVLADGGVRSGLDVVRMLALGAEAVLLGRAWAYALGAAGQTGVLKLLRIIDAEMRVAMALSGCTDVTAIDGTILADRALTGV